MNGQEYFSLNPGLFSERTQWSYQSLKSLCKELGLGGAGKRSDLELKLQRWHVARTECDENLVPSNDFEENLPMNVLGSNFNVLKMMPPSKKGGKNKKRQPLIPIVSSESEDKENYCCVSPVRINCPGTPAKSILKQDSKFEHCPPSATKMQNISFSPYNKVRVIPHRIFNIEAFDEYSDGCDDDDEHNQISEIENHEEDSDSESSMECE